MSGLSFCDVLDMMGTVVTLDFTVTSHAFKIKHGILFFIG